MLYFLVRYKIIKSGLFDAAFYLKSNPDVRKSDVDPLWHFINCGWKEGRDPSKDFSIKKYFSNHPEIKSNGTNPLLHYISISKKMRNNKGTDSSET